MAIPSRMLLSDQTWHLSKVLRLPFDHPHPFNATDALETIPATVPGNVRLDLLTAGRIQDPAIANQHRDSAWVDSWDWFYVTTLNGKRQPDERVFVRCHGIDYRWAIFANAQELRRGEGMFSRQTVELTPYFDGTPVDLAVRVWGSGALPGRQLSPVTRVWAETATRMQANGEAAYPDRSAVLKMQMGFGWDFAPPVPTIGLWDDVELLRTGHTLIQDVQVAVKLDGQGQLRIRLNSQAAKPYPLTFTIDGANFNIEPITWTVEVEPDIEELTFSFQIANPLRWSSWDRGRPNLYRLTTEVIGSDRVETRFGIRNVAWQDGYLRLNGHPLVVRGLNWVPADIFPGRVKGADYKDLLTRAKNAGANLLRVWGGGLREKQAFYDLADDLGLLIWQEFPFACVFTGAFPRDKAYLNLVETEVGEIVRQLDSHPSVALWSGGNEFSRSRNRPLIRTMAQTVAREGLGERPFLPASPAPGDAHNWHVWHGLAPFSAYLREPMPMLSEFGLQALPAEATLQTALPDNPTTNWDTIHGQPEKLFRYLRLFLPPDVTPNTASLAQLIAASQAAQATGIQLAIEQFRRQRRGGVIVWQYNEPRPAISWALLDHFRRPKLAFKGLKTWYGLLLPGLTFSPGRLWRAGQRFTAQVWGVNDTLNAETVDCRVWLDDALVFQRTGLELIAEATTEIGQIAVRLPASPGEARIEFWQTGALLTQNRYRLDWVDATPMPGRNRFRRWAVELALR